MGNALVQIQNNRVVVSSRQVAEHFEKNHRDVLRCIDELLGSAQNCATLFTKTSYTHPQNNQTYPEYLMNRDGFTLLAMGFTGKKALEWKLKYITAFNEMEEHLKVPTLPDFTNPVVAARAWADAIEQKQLVEDKVKVLAPKADVYDAFVDKKHAIGFRELAKELHVKEPILREFLQTAKIAYRQRDKWKPHASMIEKGFMVVKDVHNSQNGYTTAQALWTMQGKEFVRRKMLQLGLIPA